MINNNKIQLNNKGFTLVELIVVLLLSAILLTVGTFGILGWQDWARFKHEEAVAEEMFFAAQNQLIELDSSGALERKVITPLLEASAHSDDIDGETGYYRKHVLPESLLNSIVYEVEGGSEHKYVWTDVWSLNKNPEKEKGTILRLKAKSGDYKKYLDNELLDGIDYDSSTPLSEEQMQRVGAKVLFDLIASYVSDTSVLNHAIALEFSPDASQVFSVSFSDRNGEFLYDEDTPSSEGANAVGIMNRDLHVRNENMIGYYSVKELTQKIKGRGDRNTYVDLELRNSNVLDLILYDNATVDEDKLVSGNKLVYTICADDNSELMKFTLDVDQFNKLADSGCDTLLEASEKPTDIIVEYLDHKYTGMNKTVQVTSSEGVTTSVTGVKYRVPIYKIGKEYHIILDAADVQAQTLSYYESLVILNNEDETDDDTASFRNTFSFYRFGLKERKIYASLQIKKDGVDAGSITSGRKLIGDTIIYEDDEGEQICESPTFKDYLKSSVDSNSATFEILNCRHLYNVRYETDYKNGYTASSVASSNTYALISDLDWNDFIGKSSDDGINFFLNSFDKRKGGDGVTRYVSGIDYDGLSVATGKQTMVPNADGTTSPFYSVVTSDVTNTVEYPFPGFRCLSKNDTFTSKQNENVSNDGQESGKDNQTSADIKQYTISNLHITVTGNIIYGVYGRDIKDKCLKNNLDDYSKVLGLSDVNAIDSSGSRDARAGLMPLGLFAENIGNIQNVALNKHIVEGLQRVAVASGNRDYTVVYSCMVGGFAGNNIGTVSNLTLFDNVENIASSSRVNVTHINGRTDVGGIIGRESFTTDSSGTYVAVLSDLKNYGHVTGMENVGGIVGRAYVHYVGDDSIFGADEYTGNNQGLMHDEKGRFRYEHYHDGYRISDKTTTDGTVIDPLADEYSSAKSYSMTGQEVHRVAKVSIENCINRSVISGDELVYNYIIDTDKHTYGGNKNYTQTRRSDKSTYYGNDNTYVGRCSFIGGIAGIMQDGLMVDDVNSVYKSNAIETLYDLYASKGFFEKKYVSAGNEFSPLIRVKNCNSSMLYSETEVDEIINDINPRFSNSNSLSVEDPKLSHDYYVGGIAGIARLCSIEDCDTTYETKDKVYNDTNLVSYIFGYRYVGGLFGTADLSVFNSEKDLDEIGEDGSRNYTAINSNNVIGRLYVGGIAGGFGPGDDYQENFSFRDPALNDGTLVSQLHSIDEEAYSRVYIKNLLNTGIVLAISGRAKDDNYFATVDPKGNAWVTGVAGGIVGCSALPVVNADNIQSRDTKEQLLRLVSKDNENGFSEDKINDILDDPSVIDPYEIRSLIAGSKFGGCNVGGVGGYFRGSAPARLNSSLKASDNYTSKVDAIVFGQDIVGGGVGYHQNSINGIIPSREEEGSTGMIVLGRYMVGGALGKHDNNGSGLNGAGADTVVTESYTVVGDSYVGGVIGGVGNNSSVFKINIDFSQNSRPVNVKAIAYAGGYMGYSKTDEIHTYGELKGVDVNADVFAGGYMGVLLGNISNKEMFQFLRRKESEPAKTIMTENVNVNSKAAAGGIIGLISFNDSYEKKDSKLIDLSSALTKDKDDQKLYSDVFEEDISGNKSIFGSKTGDGSITTFDFNYQDKACNFSGVKVSSGLFAGGLIGYVPEGINLTVKNVINSNSVSTTSWVQKSSKMRVYDSPTTSQSYSYLGGIIGRVPSTMTLKNCSNNASGTKEDNTEIYDAAIAAGEENVSIAPYYESAGSTYMGGLTEVNAGKILNCTNITEYTYDDKSIAPIAGQNGVLVSEAATGNIDNCINKAGVNGVDVAGIAVVNYGTIKKSQNTSDGALTGTDVAGIATYNEGTIDRCTNEAILTGSEGTVSSVGGIVVSNTGIVSGKSSTAEDDTDIARDYIVNQGKLSGTVVGGIAAYSGGDSVIKFCKNDGSIYASDSSTDAKDSCAGGILALAEDDATSVSISSVVNTGIIKVNNETKSDCSAGIAYDTKGKGVLNACRNYAPGLKNGITATDASTIVYCLNTGYSQDNLIGSVSEENAGNMYANFYTGTGYEHLVQESPETVRFRAYQGYADFGQAYVNNVPVMGNADGEYLSTDYTIKNKKIISNMVLSQTDFMSETNHIKDAGWYLHARDKNDSVNLNTHLAFRITPLTKDGQKAYVDVDNLGIVWDNYQLTESNKFHRYWPKIDNDTVINDRYKAFLDTSISPSDMEEEAVSYYQVALDQKNGKRGSWSAFDTDLECYKHSVTGVVYYKKSITFLGVDIYNIPYLDYYFYDNLEGFYCYAYDIYYSFRNEGKQPTRLEFLDKIYENAATSYGTYRKTIWNNYTPKSVNDDTYKDEFDGNNAVKIKVTLLELGKIEYAQGSHYGSFTDISSEISDLTTGYVKSKVEGYGYTQDTLEEFLFNAYCYMIDYSSEYSDVTYEAAKNDSDLLENLYLKTIYTVLADSELMTRLDKSEKISYYVVLRDREDNVLVSESRTVEFEQNAYKEDTFSLNDLVRENNVEKSNGTRIFNIDEISNIDIVVDRNVDENWLIGVRAFTWDANTDGIFDEAMPTNDTADTTESESLYEKANTLNDILGIITDQKNPVPISCLRVKNQSSAYTLLLEGKVTGIGLGIYDPLAESYLVNDVTKYPEYKTDSIRYQIYSSVDANYMKMISSYLTSKPELIQLAE
ncbi:MAG: prepilin-type N-terminal cleavage/methylation domain-containing protein [Eubacterium sp.]|nr:prepilin-type N-terminal cleavage/methylation domain-containing protein [Eubacterium sp.]